MSITESKVKYPESWLLNDENIEDVERVKFTPEVQELLGCCINEHVFLEYPYAYVPYDAVRKISMQSNSPLEDFKDKIDIYKSESFLVGYNSNELISQDFVVCVTEEARDNLVKRNKEITRSMMKKTISKIRKNVANSWRSLNSEIELDITYSDIPRPFIQIDVSLPRSFLGQKRILTNRNCDSVRDGYVELVPKPDVEVVENVWLTLLPKAIQTTLEGREISTQTYPGNPKNMWTQYEYKYNYFLDSDGTKRDQKEENREMSKIPTDIDTVEENYEQSNTIKSALQLFLEQQSETMNDNIKYNAATNLYANNFIKLTSKFTGITHYFKGGNESLSLINLKYTNKKVVSNLSWHPLNDDILVACYVNDLNNYNENYVHSEGCTALIWTLSNTLHPKTILNCDTEIYCITFCPYNPDIVIGSSFKGAIVVWNIGDEKDEIHDIPVINTKIVSEELSANTKIISIEWIPLQYHIGETRRVTNSKTSTSSQFMTAFDNGTIIIWDLRWRFISRLSVAKSNDLPNIDVTLRLAYRLSIDLSDKSVTSFFSVFCLPCSNSREIEKDTQNMKYQLTLWLGTVDGELLFCTWEENLFDVEVDAVQNCKVLERVGIHDGPILKIVKSPHSEDALLTIGGTTFALWKIDYFDCPLIWRKRASRLTACCWSSRPGIFFLTTADGDIEVWNVLNKSKEPVFLQSISDKRVSGLYSGASLRRKIVVVCDCNGVLRIYEETEEPEEISLERIDRFEEYVWREVKKKRSFQTWQANFLNNDPAAVEKKSLRERRELEEVTRKKQNETKKQLLKEKEYQMRMEEEERLRKIKLPRDVVWKVKNLKWMKKDLLERKGYNADVLKKTRSPIICQQEDRHLKLEKGKIRSNMKEEHFKTALSNHFPGILDKKLGLVNTVKEVNKGKEIECIGSIDYALEYEKTEIDIRKLLILNENVQVEFNVGLSKSLHKGSRSVTGNKKV